MSFKSAVIGTTLSQRALACHIDRSTSWVRKQGKIVVGYALYGKQAMRETWQRIDYHYRPRCQGYKRIA